MLPPLPRCSGWAYSSLKLPHPYQPSPIPLSGRPAHRPFRGLLDVHSHCGLHTRAVTKLVTVIRRLQTFRRLHACSGCFRLERSPGGPCTHWKSAALSRRTWIADLRPCEALGKLLTWSRRSPDRNPAVQQVAVISASAPLRPPRSSSHPHHWVCAERLQRFVNPPRLNILPQV